MNLAHGLGWLDQYGLPWTDDLAPVKFLADHRSDSVYLLETLSRQIHSGDSPYQALVAFDAVSSSSAFVTLLTTSPGCHRIGISRSRRTPARIHSSTSESAYNKSFKELSMTFRMVDPLSDRSAFLYFSSNGLRFRKSAKPITSIKCA
jgi:hypothetical protein